MANANPTQMIETVILPWKNLARIDAELTSCFLDNETTHSYKIETNESEILCNVNDDEVKHFLQHEYQLSRDSVVFKKVDYIPHSIHSSLGVFSAKTILADEFINGLSGFLAEIAEDEIVEGFNDISVIHSELLKTSWVMLGPVSFVNSACCPNAEYAKMGSVMRCKALKEIPPNEEVLVLYDKHFFGAFNCECLCRFKQRHGPPFVDKLPQKKRQCRSITNQQLHSTPKKPSIKVTNEVFPLRDPRHRYYPFIVNRSCELDLTVIKRTTHSAVTKTSRPLKFNVSNISEALEFNVIFFPVHCQGC